MEALRRRVPPQVWGPVLTGILGAAFALWLFPPTTQRLGPTVVELSGRLGGGRTILQVTPFGTVEAPTHAAPLTLRAALKQVDIERLGRTITTPQGRRSLEAEIEGALGSLVLRTILKELAGAALVAGLLGAAVFHHRRRAIVISGASGAITSAILLLVTVQTFEQSAFEHARYTGSLAKARQVIETLTEHTETFDVARSRYETAARRVSELMVLLAQPDVDPATGTTAILHISDVHANPIGLEIARELAREFEVRAVVDTGDLASSFLDTGELSSLADPVDQALVGQIERLGVPYVFVPGNHDSIRLRNAVARAENATVLRSDVTTVAGIEILGWEDPTFATVPIPEAEKAAERLTYAHDVAAEVARSRPDILAVHDARLAANSFGLVPLVLSGHFHARSIETNQGTLSLAVGSTGATGVKSLTIEADLLYEAQILYFEGDDLVAIDYVTLKGLGEDFTLERDTLSEELIPSPSPSPSPSI